MHVTMTEGYFRVNQRKNAGTPILGGSELRSTFYSLNLEDKLKTVKYFSRAHYLTRLSWTVTTKTMYFHNCQILRRKKLATFTVRIWMSRPVREAATVFRHPGSYGIRSYYLNR